MIEGKRHLARSGETRMWLLSWGAVVMFALLVMSAALYGLTASGHFPSEHRAEALRSTSGAAILWGTMALALATAIVGLGLAWAVLPWTWAVIVGGAALFIKYPAEQVAPAQEVKDALDAGEL